MRTVVILYIVNVVVNIRSAPTDLQEVWLKDVTTKFQTDKRTLSHRVLGDELTFRLMQGSHYLTLNLKRNYGIDPNADIYVVQKSNDGRYQPHKTHHLDGEDLAYYQDVENGAYVTVRCIERSNGQCDRVIKGNIRIGDRNYDLQPADTDVTSRDVLDVPELFGRRYVLHDQENRGVVNVNEINVDQQLVDLTRRVPDRQRQRDRFPLSDTMLSSRHRADAYKSARKVKKDNARQVYDVGITVLIDSGIWDLFSFLVNISDPIQKERKVKKKIRGFYAHIINGVDLRYKGIKDNSISISVTLRQFVIFKLQTDFPHKDSNVVIYKGVKSVEVKKYLDDVLAWDIFEGWELPEFDHAMMFTRYDLYDDIPPNNGVRGLCWTGRICESGSRTSVVEVGDYFLTVGTATHELGHSLGAVHDGTGSAIACKSEDLFIMTQHTPIFDKEKPSSENLWIFSNCSLDAFKSTLKDRECVKHKSDIYNQLEWTKFTSKLPGEVYSVDEQCKIFVGHNSFYCRLTWFNTRLSLVDKLSTIRFGGVSVQTESKDICLFMKCGDERTGECLPNNFSAARGTICGINKWCIDGRCVAKPPKYVQPQ